MRHREKGRRMLGASRAANDPKGGAVGDVLGCLYSTNKAWRRQGQIVPNPLRSYEQALEYEHRDLPMMEDRQLYREACWARAVLAQGVDRAAEAWLFQRLAAIQSERRRRHAAARDR